jgi:hypothetical protein
MLGNFLNPEQYYRGAGSQPARGTALGSGSESGSGSGSASAPAPAAGRALGALRVVAGRLGRRIMNARLREVAQEQRQQREREDMERELRMEVC